MNYLGSGQSIGLISMRQMTSFSTFCFILVFIVNLQVCLVFEAACIRAVLEQGIRALYGAMACY